MVAALTILRGFGPFVGKETTSWFDSLSRTASLKAWVSSPDITLDLVLIRTDSEVCWFCYKYDAFLFQLLGNTFYIWFQL